MADRILLVEDNRADVELLELALREVGLDVWIDAITDGAEAMLRLDAMCAGDEHPPDLMILDLNLPGFSGQEILMRVRSAAPLEDVPVIVLTSSTTRQSELEGLGADGYLVKPTRYTDLLALIEELRAFLPTASF